ncbi:MULTISPECIES: hypothetical protein [Streptosporangium]|uniref:Secreted protein n=1 Tax=Streptosporangium brasiliense TaxID=47480 RepID=A0ABT9QVG1_9ACTN|nr:hypothetical protein [Streptosporangium brasiliense]MDP9860973.1 hypothetical protein [Streptosporangium brasiliense]
MPSKRRLIQAAAGCAFTAAAVLSLGASSSAQSSVPDISPASPPSVTEPPAKPKARALTAREIKQQGLDRYIDMSRQRETAPTLVDASQSKAAASVPTPAMKAGAGTTGLASGCWYLQTGYGSATLGGTADHTWCGDGASVTYTSASCTGSTNWPTYRYEGCQNNSSYGVGWNVWDVTDRWHFCTAYRPSTGACGSRSHPWQKNRYGANGQVWFLGWSG